RHHCRRSRRRAGRRADRRGHRDRDGRLGVPEERRRRPGGQLRPDPRARGVRHETPERTLFEAPALGEAVISVGMTEPEAGSAVTDLQTTAKPEDGGYRINGSKIFTTHSKYAELMPVYVRFGPGSDGIGSVLVDTKGQGVRFGKPSKFMSQEEWVQTYFENAFVPADRVVLKEGGFKKQIAGFNVERIGNAARSLALGRYAYERAREWAKQRKQFGRLLCEFQGLQWKF